MGGAVGSIAGSVVGGLFQKDAAGDAADAQEAAALAAIEQFKPYNVSSPLGAATVQGQNINLALSSQAQGLLDLFSGEAGQGLEAATQERLGILDQLAARGEEEARRFTREGLFAAGNLGTHFGTRQVGEVERAIADSRLSRMLEARSMAFNERQGAFGNALAMYQLPNTLAGVSINRNPAAVAGAQGMIGAAQIRSAPYAGFAQGLSQALPGIGSAIGDKIGSIFGSSPATSQFGGYTIAAPGGSF